MSCASCGRANPAGARFCAGCGASLAPRCPSCGAESPADARFCIGCGSSLALRPAESAAQRKVVTIVFADLIGSTALHERLDPESVNRLMDRYYRALRTPIEAHGGSVVQLMGDGVMCAFGVPRVAEDDALRAVHAGVEVQRAFRAFAEREGAVARGIGLRVAINTGEVVVSDDHAAGIGDPLNVAARLQQEARDGDVLITGSTQRLVRDRITLEPAGSFSFKGRSEPVAAFRVVSLERPAGTAAIAFVGRDAELARITAVYEAAAAGPATRLAVVLGSPGLGKSRLVAELARRLGERATVLTVQCQAAGGASFAPLAEALRAQLGIEEGSGGSALRAAIDALGPGEEAERARIAQGIGALLAGTPAPPEETFFVVRRLLAALAARRPLVLAIDDLQWAEPLLFDLTEHLVQWGAGVPLLVLVAARPELRASRSSLTVAGGLVADVVTLAGLDANAATRLAANVIGAEALPAAVAGRVLAASEGNPLFVGELVRMLVQDGALRREADGWTTAVELAELTMPPTIQALLAARIERLRPEERVLLERASVVGRHFSRAAVAHLLPAEARAGLDACLESLRRSELVEPDTGWLLGEPALRFHHVLIRDAAYRRLLKETRAELHERLADWIAARAGGSVEHDETLGWHLEQAHQNLRELGLLDEHGRALGARAARHLAAAGRRALARDDLLPAAGLLGRALDRLGADDPARADLVLDWCEALLAAPDVATATRALAELGRFVADSERLRAWHACFSGQLAVLTDPKALHASAEAVAAAADTLSAAGDVAGEAKAHAIHALVLAQLGKIGACEAALDKALAAARRADDRRRANAVLAGAPLAALWGPSPVTRASGRCLDVVRVLRITAGAPAVEAVALSCQAVLETLRGRGEAARRMIASSRRLVEELGITQRVLEADLFAGLIELLEGDAAAAERWLRAAWDGLRGQGLGINAAQAGALLARALLAQGRVDEAEVVSVESESLAGDSFKAAIAWRGVRAEVLAARGEPAAAIELARAAVDIAAATDDLLDHADARASLAVALRAAGRGAEADAEQRRAVELWEAKGATLLVERARRETTARAPEPAAIETQVPRRALRRRTASNAATLHMARLEEAVAARDLTAVASLLVQGQHVDHVHGHTHGSDTLIERFRSMIERSADLAFHNEPIAALGPALALARFRETGSGVATGDLAVGSYEIGGTVLIEADSEARMLRAETFAPDKLGDAVVRLYERHAELLPEGPERTRAAAIARSVAGLYGPGSGWRERSAPLALDVEARDHRTVGFGSLRGADAVLGAIAGLRRLSDRFDDRFDDVLDLRPDTLLVRATTSGTIRASGGAYRQDLCQLFAFGPDGLVARWEQFDAEQEAEALARFDELAAAPARSVRRRVRPNAATALAARVNAAIAARDADTVALVHSDATQVTDHSLGVVMDKQETLDWWRLFFRDRDAAFWIEPIASLGASLALCSRTWSGSASGDAAFEVGAFQRDVFDLIEADAESRLERVDTFAPDRLGDAVARLYERHSELLPEGPERERASATARTFAALLADGIDVERWSSVFAADVEAVDPRTVGFGSLHGAAALREAARAFRALVEDPHGQVETVLDLRADAMLVRWRNSGALRDGGGPFERTLLMLWAVGSDGLLTRWEQREPEHEAEALARFDELTAETPARPTSRRVRPNAATAHAARFDAAIAARDADAIPTLFSDDPKGFDHVTHTAWDWQAVSAWRSLLLAENPTCRHEPLVTLGDALTLCRMSLSASGLARGSFDVGAYEKTDIHLIEVDAQGRRCWSETFATDRLGDAVVRLYERHAELLPAGPERERAAATARTVGELTSRELPLGERYIATYAPDVEFADHRALVALPPARGAAEMRRRIELWFGVAERTDIAFDDVLDLRLEGLLLRQHERGYDQASGGRFEARRLVLYVFDAAGLQRHVEFFDPERAAEALARFDALAGEAVAPAARFENAAARTNARSAAAVAARDWAAFATCYAPEFRRVDLRRLLQMDLDRDQSLAWTRDAFERNLRASAGLLATRGDRLALLRGRASESNQLVGPSEHEFLLLCEVNERGEYVREVFFDPDDLDTAWAELDARYVAGEGAPHAAFIANLQAYVRAAAARDDDAIRRHLPLELTFTSHRRLLQYAAVTRDEWLASIRNLGSLGEMVLRTSVDHIPRLSARAGMMVLRNQGTVGGGSFETSIVIAFAHDGVRPRTVDEYDLDQLDAAFERYAELTAATSPPRIENAATRAMEQTKENWNTRDWRRIEDSLLAGYRVFDRRKRVQLELDREQALASFRWMFEMGSSWAEIETLATRGERLALGRFLFETSGRDVGASEIDSLMIYEMDERGARKAMIRFDPDDLDAAYAELEARYDAGEGAAFARTRATLQRVNRGVAARDWELLASAFAPDFTVEDHRQLGTLSAMSRDEWVASARSLVELRPDAALRIDHVLGLDDRRCFTVGTWVGREADGAFEIQVAIVAEIGGERIRRWHAYALDQLDAARARYDALGASAPADPLRIPPNAATRTRDRQQQTREAGDWDAFAALLAPDMVFDDRRRGIRLTGDRDTFLASARVVANARTSRTLLATAGEGLALDRAHWHGSNQGAFELETLTLWEVDADGRVVAVIVFDPDDRRAAQRELLERHARSGAGRAIPEAVFELQRALMDCDLERCRAALPADFVVHDHRRVRLWTLDSADAWIAWMATLFEQSPDVVIALLCDLAREEHGALTLSSTNGILPDGGEFEQVFVTLWHHPGGRLVGLELFEVDDLDRARARLEELRPAPGE